MRPAFGAVFIMALIGAWPGMISEADATPAVPAASTPQQATADSQYGCLVCHAEKRRAYLLGVHSERSVRCHDCHGGDPASLEIATAHTGDFVADLSRRAAIEICTRCHSDPNQMRQYGLPADQLAELEASRHGQLLLDEGNQDAPACSDCHDPHTTLQAEDARSSVNPFNILGTCERCHADETLMARYGLPTDQVAEFKRSRHWTALTEDHNLAAPTCVSCHGSHAALPPGLGEITNVCGRCHVAVRQALDAGAHGAASRDGSLAGCTGCHENHGTTRLVADQIAASCVDCHDAESAEAGQGVELQEVILRAESDIERGAHAIEMLAEAGRSTVDARFGLRTAITHYRRMTRLMHGLSVDALEDSGRQLGSITAALENRAEVAEEERWEHKLILIPVWFFALAITFLAGLRLRRLASATS